MLVQIPLPAAVSHTPSPGVERYLLLGWPGSVEDTEELFRGALTAIDAGAAERDSLNRLVLGERMTWRQVLLLRALCRYLRQTGLGLGLESEAGRLRRVVVAPSSA